MFRRRCNQGPASALSLWCSGADAFGLKSAAGLPNTTMVRIRSLPFALVLIALLVPEGAAAESATRIIVKREPGLTAAERADVRADAGVRLVETLRLPRTEVVSAPAGDAREALRELSADAGRRVRGDRLAPPGVTEAIRSSPTCGASRTPASDRRPVRRRHDDADMDVHRGLGCLSTGAGQTVAVVDTRRRGRAPGPRRAILRGCDWVDDDTNPDDENGHGTHVTGTIAAQRNNTKGIAGVAPDADRRAAAGCSTPRVRLRVRLADGVRLGRRSRRARSSTRASARPTRSTAERDAIAAHPETLYVVAAGNDGHVGTTSTPARGTRARTTSRTCCASAPRTPTTRPPSFSNYGADVGRRVRAGRVDLLDVSVNVADLRRPYCFSDGTSMASPHVAAEAALPAGTRSRPERRGRDEERDLDSVDSARDTQRAVGWPARRVDAAARAQLVPDTPALVDSHERTPTPTASLTRMDICDAGAFNPTQTDTDQDGSGDACDATPRRTVDADGDGKSACSPTSARTSPGPAPDGCPVATPTPTPTPTPDPPVAGDSDRDGIGDAPTAARSSTRDAQRLPAPRRRRAVGEDEALRSAARASPCGCRPTAPRRSG